MIKVRHVGEGNFGVVIVFKNDDKVHRWYKTKAKRDAAYKDASSKMTNKISVNKTER